MLFLRIFICKNQEQTTKKMNILLTTNKKIAILCCFILLLVLSGCFSISSKKRQPSLKELNSLYDAHIANIYKITSWKLSAKMQIKTPTEYSKVLLTWKQNADNYNLHLTGPLAVNIADITGNSNNISVKFADKLITSANPNSLIAELTGADIPVGSLKYWVKAIPNPSYVLSKKLNNNGCITEMQQQGYTVKYDNYQKFNKNLLPTKINIATTDTKLTIIIDKWKL